MLAVGSLFLVALVVVALLAALNRLASNHLAKVRISPFAILLRHRLTPPLAPGPGRLSSIRYRTPPAQRLLLMTIRFVFFPDPLPLAARASTSRLDAQPSRIYYYGWEETGTLLVAGGIEALSLDDAQRRLSDLPSRLTTGPRGNICIVAESVGEGQEEEETGLDRQLVSLKFDGGIPRLSDVTSTQKPPTIILYTPPSPSRLQFLSLLPLQLDLTSFSTPPRHGRASASVQPDAGDEENTRLSGKLRHSAKLDFSSPTNHPAWKEGSPDLQLVVDRVRPCFSRWMHCLTLCAVDQSVAASQRFARPDFSIVVSNYPFHLRQQDLQSPPSVSDPQTAGQCYSDDVELGVAVSQRNSSEGSFRYK